MSRKPTSRQAGWKSGMRKHWLAAILLLFVSVQIHAQNGWTQKADMLPGRVGATASVVGGKIYVFGGVGVDMVDVDINQVYDPSTNQWDTTLTPMPTARGFPFSGVVHDTIYVLGGGYPTAKKTVEAYVPATDSWVTKADLLLARIASNAVVVDGIIYHAGGSYNQTECQAYCTSPNFCEIRTPIPPTFNQRGALSVTAYNGLMYTFGGSNYSPWAPLDTVCAYDPETDTWTGIGRMPTPRFGFQTYLVNGKIYAVGGSQSNGTALATVDVYDPVTNTWDDTTAAPMPHGSAWFAGAVVNNKIYVIGGTTDWVTGGSEVWEYDPLAVGVDEEAEVPEKYALFQNYPNPFNPATEIRYQVSEVSHVTLKVYDVVGRVVATLVNEVKHAGTYQVTWAAEGVASGVYFYRLQAGQCSAVKQMLLLR